MKFPNKIIPYQKSILAKFPIVLSHLEEKERSPAELYKKTKNNVEDVAEFSQILACLFALHKIEWHDGKVVLHVKRN
jgi:hypothetical protein